LNYRKQKVKFWRIEGCIGDEIMGGIWLDAAIARCGCCGRVVANVA